MLRDIRKNYQHNQLDENTLDKNPFVLFQEWLDDAIRNKVHEPTAMILATMVSNQPDTRVVLLKELQPEGFVFFTNYLGKKGLQIEENPRVALNFFWPELERQVRVLGEVVQIDSQQSTDYFMSRPRESQLGAWASKQSRMVSSREELEEQFNKYKQKFEGRVVPKPEYWGGYLVKPFEMEFWQGRPNRLHDRIQYQLTGGNWGLRRLQP